MARMIDGQLWITDEDGNLVRPALSAGTNSGESAGSNFDAGDYAASQAQSGAQITYNGKSYIAFDQSMANDPSIPSAGRVQLPDGRFGVDSQVWAQSHPNTGSWLDDNAFNLALGGLGVATAPATGLLGNFSSGPETLFGGGGAAGTAGGSITGGGAGGAVSGAGGGAATTGLFDAAEVATSSAFPGATAGAAVPGAASTAAAAGLGGGGAAAAGTALSRVLDGTATTADYLSALGPVAASALGFVGADQQADASKAIADNLRADRAPALSAFNNALANPDTFYNSAPQQGAVTGILNKLSVGGNPAGNPGALAKAAAFNLGGYNDYLRTLSGPAFGTAGTEANINLAGAGADAGKFAAIGFGVNNLFNPQPSLAELVNQIKRLGDGKYSL